MTIACHHHLNVTDVAAQKKFFVDTLGGEPVAIASPAGVIIRFSNALIFLREQAPTGGTKGTTVNHFAFGVPNIRQMVDRVKAAGWTMATRAETPPTQEVKDDLAFMVDQQTDVAFLIAPDDTKIEFIEIPRQTASTAVHHIHFLTPQVAEMKAWYVSVLDAKPGKRGNFEAADMPGVNLTYSPSPTPVVGTLTRLDHIGFGSRISRRRACGGWERGIVFDQPFALTGPRDQRRDAHRSVGNAHSPHGGTGLGVAIMRVHLDYSVNGLDVELPDHGVTVIGPRGAAARGPARRAIRRCAHRGRPPPETSSPPARRSRFRSRRRARSRAARRWRPSSKSCRAVAGHGE
jgi:catechol 2,3-dioxygenase-like lactoylglutathione lyase family enzyme